MKQQKHPSIHRVPDRPGEGAYVGISRKQDVNVAGTTGVTFTADMSSSPVPERRYVADIASVVQDNDAVQLIFGQKKLGSQTLRTLVIIHIPGPAIHRYLQSAIDMLALMNTFKSRFLLKEATLTEVSDEPDQSVALAASIIIASFSGRDACVDFYYSSPFVSVQVQRGGKFVVDPVVRVMLPTNLWRAVCDKFESIKDTLPKDTPEMTT